MLYLLPHTSMALSTSDKLNINIATKVPLLSHDLTSKPSSKKILKTLKFLSIVTKISLIKTLNTN